MISGSCISLQHHLVIDVIVPGGRAYMYRTRYSLRLPANVLSSGLYMELYFNNIKFIINFRLASSIR